MKNIMNLMQKAQEMQKRAEDIQQELETIDVTGESGGGLVSVSITAKGDAKKVTIAPEIFQDYNAEILEDLIVTAFNNAKEKAENIRQEKLQQLSSGVSLPEGLNLPFKFPTL